jgi:uncharacterized membrane protein
MIYTAKDFSSISVMKQTNLGLIIKGFLMGTADVIPGISGGTVAFLTGIYEELVKTIAAFNPKNLIKIIKDSKPRTLIDNLWKSLNLGFLLLILAGIIPAIFLAALWIPFAIDQFPQLFFSFCLGCIVFTLIKPFQEQSWEPLPMLFLALGIISMATLILFPKELHHLRLTDINSTIIYEGKLQKASRYKIPLIGDTLKENQLNLSINGILFPIKMNRFNNNETIELPSSIIVKKERYKMVIYQKSLEEPGPMKLFISGAIAICAMILPGISGAFILILLDMYVPVLLALKEFEFSMIGPFILGCLVGIISVAKLLQQVFHKYKRLLIPLLLGVILGSFFKLWPWNYGEYALMESIQIISIFFVSFFSCVLIQKLVRKESA